MKCLLVAVNAKYIHSNLAVYSLKNYTANSGVDIELAEYTINNLTEKVVQDIYLRKPDIVAFSCYIWNISFIRRVIVDISKILPGVHIWLGGPEVSFECRSQLEELPWIKGIIAGEGEDAFAKLMNIYSAKGTVVDSELKNINGLVYRDEACIIYENPPIVELDMNKLPFVYSDLSDFENRIIYYESSRGCPFKCSYCLSSVDKKLRFREISLVKEELKYFLDRRVRQVKFIDRTFNAHRERTLDIWRFILENDNGVTNFHFEISADLLYEDQLELLSRFRAGLVQLEIGIQSTCEKTLQEIHRYVDFKVLSENVRRLLSFGNIHCHVDLIAGLPYEDIETFKKSFNDVYALKAEQLQLGFLKVLKGSLMYEKAGEYGIAYTSAPPYEVLYTRWLSYEDILLLKGVEEMVEVYYNSGQFISTITCLERYFNSAFDMFEELSKFYKDNYAFEIKHSRQARYEILLEFIKIYAEEDFDKLKTILVCDYYARENARVRPSFAENDLQDKDAISDMYVTGLKEICGNRFEDVPYRRLLNETHVEAVSFDIDKFVRSGEYKEGMHYIVFDYSKRSPLTSNAEMIIN